MPDVPHGSSTKLSGPRERSEGTGSTMLALGELAGLQLDVCSLGLSTRFRSDPLKHTAYALIPFV